MDGFAAHLGPGEAGAPEEGRRDKRDGPCALLRGSKNRLRRTGRCIGIQGSLRFKCEGIVAIRPSRSTWRGNCTFNERETIRDARRP